MPLDPSISLGVKTPQTNNYLAPIETGLKLAALSLQPELIQQQISASRTSEEATRAGIPGIQAESALKQRDLDYTKFLKDNAENFYDTNPETGQKTFNMNKTFDVLGKAGYLDKARQGMAEDLSNQATTIANASGQIKNQSDAVNFGNLVQKSKRDTLAYAANLLSNTPEDQREQALKDIVSGIDNIFPKQLNMSAEITNGLTKQEPVLGTDGKPVIGEDGKPVTRTVVNKDAVYGYKQASIDAATQQNYELQKRELNANLERYAQSPEAYNGNSTLSVLGRKILAKQGIDVPEGTPYRDLVQLYGDKLKDLATNDVVSTESRLGIKEKIAAAQIDINNISAAQAAAIAYGKPIMGTRIGSFTSDVWNRLVKESPQLERLRTAVQLYNSRFKDDPIDPGKLTVAQILEKLGEFKTYRQNDLAINAKNFGPNINTGSTAGAENVPSVAPGGGTPSTGAGIVPPQTQAAPQPAPTPEAKKSSNVPAGKIRVKSPTGQIGLIPEGRWEAYKSQNYTRVD